MTETTTTKAGDRVCYVARDGARCARVRGVGSWAIWTGAIYEAVARKRDGVLIWRRVGNFGGTRSGDRPSPAYVAELIELAEHPWLDVRHNEPVEHSAKRVALAKEREALRLERLRWMEEKEAERRHAEKSATAEAAARENPISRSDREQEGS